MGYLLDCEIPMTWRQEPFQEPHEPEGFDLYGYVQASVTENETQLSHISTALLCIDGRIYRIL